MRNARPNLLLLAVAGLLLSGCSMLPSPVVAPTATPDSSTDGRVDLTVEDRDFPVVDHYVGVEELAASAISTACMEPQDSYTQEEAEARWSTAILFDASEYPSRFSAVPGYIEDARHYEAFLIGQQRVPESYPAAEKYCQGERVRWEAEISRQQERCAEGGVGVCWSRDLAGENPAPPSSSLDLNEFFTAPVAVDENYVGVHILSATVIAAECAERTVTWTQKEADAYRELSDLFGASEFTSARMEQRNYRVLADDYDAFLVGVKRPPESFPAAERACDFATTRWAAELERQEKACVEGAQGVPVCWSRDLLER